MNGSPWTLFSISEATLVLCIMTQKSKTLNTHIKEEKIKSIEEKISKYLIVSVRLNGNLLASTNPGIQIIMINPRQQDRVTHVSMVYLPTLSSLLSQMQGLLTFMRV